MKNKFQLLFILSMIIIISFPSISFSEMKTVQGEYCDVYLGDMKNIKELNDFRKIIKTKSLENGLYKIPDLLGRDFTDNCLTYVIDNYLEKIVIVSHTEKNRNICDKVKITLEPKVINKYLSQENCTGTTVSSSYLFEGWIDIDDVLIKKSNKINIGIIIETKIPDIEVSKKEQLENEQEKQFFDMTQVDKNKYKVVDRRHLKTILEEQKFSSSGLTENETVKLGKLLNLDIIVLRLIYDNSRVTKVLKVDTGEVLLFKTYKTE